jgi:hypothetical protein
MACASTDRPEQPAGDRLVVTLVPVGVAAGPIDRLSPQRYPEGSRVVAVAPDSDVELLSVGMSAAGGPDVSSDGERVLFAGRSLDRPRWTIYEVDRPGATPRRVVHSSLACLDPAYLSGGLIVAVCADPRSEADPAAAPRWSLYVAGPDRAEPERITFGVYSAFDPTPLADGRILFAMERSSGGATDLFTVNPDGTLVEPFGDSHDRAEFLHRPRQQADGDVLFLAAALDGVTARVMRQEFNRADDARAIAFGASAVADSGPAAVIDGALAAEPLSDGFIVVADLDDTGAPTAGRVVLEIGNNGEVVERLGEAEGLAPIEAMAWQPSVKPRGRPRTADRVGLAGYLIGYSASRSDGAVGPAPGSAAPQSVRLHTWVDGAQVGLAPEAAGERVTTVNGAGPKPGADLPVHGDGSFFLQVPADRPLRIATVDAAGATISASSWFWVRGNEARACFGCHAGHTAAPTNRPIEAIANPPVELTGPVGIDSETAAASSRRGGS